MGLPIHHHCYITSSRVRIACEHAFFVEKKNIIAHRRPSGNIRQWQAGRETEELESLIQVKRVMRLSKGAGEGGGIHSRSSSTSTSPNTRSIRPDRANSSQPPILGLSACSDMTTSMRRKGRQTARSGGRETGRKRPRPDEGETRCERRMKREEDRTSPLPPPIDLLIAAVAVAAAACRRRSRR